jgi:hypothetical protein
VMLRDPWRREHTPTAPFPTAFWAQEVSPGMPVGYLDASAQRFRVLNGRLDMLVGMPWPQLRISAVIRPV